MKKICKALIAVVVLICAALAFAACGGDPQDKAVAVYAPSGHFVEVTCGYVRLDEVVVADELPQDGSAEGYERGGYLVFKLTAVLRDYSDIPDTISVDFVGAEVNLKDYNRQLFEKCLTVDEQNNSAEGAIFICYALNSADRAAIEEAVGAAAAVPSSAADNASRDIVLYVGLNAKTTSNGREVAGPLYFALSFGEVVFSENYQIKI